MSQVVEEIGRKLFGNMLDDIKSYLIQRDEPDKKYAVPTGRTINVFVVLETKAHAVIRHESDPYDVSTITMPNNVEVPAMLNTKFQSGAVRRNMLRILRQYYDMQKTRINAIIKEYTGVELGEWNCAVRPQIQRGKSAGGKSKEFIEGYCGMCPSCLIFGYAVQGEGDYNVKSRVEGDLYVSPIPLDVAVKDVTFNAVDEVTHTTLMSGEIGGRTGALFSRRMIDAGIPFVGKLALRDMTLSELILTLLSIATITRVGGVTTHHGLVDVKIPALLFSRYEVGSGYDIAYSILDKTGGRRVTVEEVINKVVEYVGRHGNAGVFVIDRNLSEKLKALLDRGNEDVMKELVYSAWVDVLKYKKSIELFIQKESSGKQKKK